MKKIGMLLLGAMMLFLAGCGCSEDAMESATEASTEIREDKSEEDIKKEDLTLEEAGYYYNVSNNEATIVGVADDNILDAEQNLTIPATLGGYKVTSIGKDAFMYFYGVNKITLHENIKSVAPRTLTGAKRITVSSKNEHYRDINGILFSKDETELLCYPAGKNDTEYTIPDSVKKIGEGAFDSAYHLTEITIPDSVAEIGTEAFDITSLKMIKVDSKNEHYKDLDGILFTKDETVLVEYPAAKAGGEYAVPDSVRKIGAGAFSHTPLSEIYLPESVETIGDKAFYVCTNLTEIDLPEGLKKIGEYAFETSNVKEITFPDSLEEIGDYAFTQTSIKTFEIPKNVKLIGKGAFSSYEVTYIGVDSENKHYKSLDGILFTKDEKKLIRYPNGKVGNYYAVPDGVEEISNGAFRSCPLEEIVLSDSVKYIGEDAFGYCSQLKEITMPEKITKIENGAFLCCLSLEKIEIPQGVTEIGDLAFNECNQLKVVKIPAKVEKIGDSAFSGCFNLEKIIVDNKNKYYTDVDGILFTKDETELIIYPANKMGSEYRLPDSVTKIANDAFYRCKFEEITINEGIEEITAQLFWECINLKKVIVPKSVKKIANYIFYGTSVEEIIYRGSEKEWNNIEKGEYGTNEENIKVTFMG